MKAVVGYANGSNVAHFMECSGCELDFLDDFPDCEECCFSCDYIETCEHVCEDIKNGNTDSADTCCFERDDLCLIDDP